MPVNNVSLLSVNSFSGLGASEVINISAVPVNTGLVIVYITDSVISNLVLTGGSVASIAAPIATFVVAGGIASVWVLQNGEGITAITPTIPTVGTYMSAVVYEIPNTISTAWTTLQGGSSALYDTLPSKQGALVGVYLQGAGHEIPNIFIAAMENYAAGQNQWIPVTVDCPWTVDLNDGSGCFAHYIGEGNQQPVFEHETFGEPLATVGIVLNGIVVFTISPATAHINKNATQQFTVAPGVNVTWSASAGTVSATGLYTAPNTTGTFYVSATSVANPFEAATATVVVTGGS